MSWDELDADNGDYFGVFNADDYSARPIAIFGSEREAQDWVAFMKNHPNPDERWGQGGDHAFCVVRGLQGLQGKAWNSYDPVPPPESEFAKRVTAEVARAVKEHGERYASDHEAFAVLLEEVEEVKEWVWKKRRDRDRGAMVKELVQVAATCSKWAEQLEAPK